MDSTAPRPRKRTLTVGVTRLKPTTRRGSKLNQRDLLTLVRVVEDILPDSQEDWDVVAVEFNKTQKGLHRTEKKVREDFLALVRCQKPTGDPNCPDEVRRAKRAMRPGRERIDEADGDTFGDTFGDAASDAEEVAAGALMPEDDQPASMNVFLEVEDFSVSSSRTSSARTGTPPRQNLQRVPQKRASSELGPTPVRQAGLTPQLSSIAKQRFRVDKAIEQFAQTPAASTSASSVMELLLAQIQAVREERRDERERREQERKEEKERREEKRQERTRERAHEREQNAQQMQMLMMLSGRFQTPPAQRE